MINTLAEGARNQQSFGQFLHLLRPENKALVRIQEKYKKTKLLC